MTTGWERVALKCNERLDDKKHVKHRQSGNTTLSYIEGWHALREANRIFGFGAWSRETTLIPLGEPYAAKNKYGKELWHVHYAAKVRITVTMDDHSSIVIRDGCGFGSGINSDVGAAYEGAIKEAETDATKRALVTFGNQFGLELYDKDRIPVSGVSGEEDGQAGSLPASDERQGMPSRTNSSATSANGLSGARSKDGWAMLEPALRAQSTAKKIAEWWYAEIEAIDMLEERQHWQFFELMIGLGLHKCTTSKGADAFFNMFEPKLNLLNKRDPAAFRGLQDQLMARVDELKQAEKLKAQAEKAFGLEPGEATLTVQEPRELTNLDAG